MGTISNDPASIPQKAREKFSVREVGYIMAKLCARFNKRDGENTLSDLMMALYSIPSVQREMFQAGWEAFMIERLVGLIVKSAEFELRVLSTTDDTVNDDLEERIAAFLDGHPWDDLIKFERDLYNPPHFEARKIGDGRIVKWMHTPQGNIRIQVFDRAQHYLRWQDSWYGAKREERMAEQSRRDEMCW